MNTQLKKTYVTTVETIDSIMQSRTWQWLMVIATVASAAVAIRNLYLTHKKIQGV